MGSSKIKEILVVHLAIAMAMNLGIVVSVLSVTSKATWPKIAQDVHEDQNASTAAERGTSAENVLREGIILEKPIKLRDHPAVPTAGR
jgi:hypothetical protein